ITFAPNGTSNLSSTGTLTVGPLDMSGSNETVVFGSAGNVGTLFLGPTAAGSSLGTSNTLDVAYGTLRNGGILGMFTTAATSTTVNSGATLSINDQNTAVQSLLGAGAVTLGTKAATVLTLDGGNFGGA